jgi:WD40 repeat protein
VAFDDKLERFAFPQPGDRISLRRLKDNIELANFPSPPATQLLFSRDGKFLAGRISDDETWLWALNGGPSTKEPVPVLKLTGAEKLSAMAFSPDSRVFALSGGPRELAFYDLTSALPRETARWSEVPRMRGIGFDPTGQRLAVTSERESVAEIREVNTGHVLHRLSHPAGVTGVDWSPDGTELATGSEDFLVRVWDAETGTIRHTLEGHQNVSVRPVYHPNGQILATAGWDAMLRFWGPGTGRLLFNGPASHDWQRFSRDGAHLAVANYDGVVQVYRVAPSAPVRTFAAKTLKLAPLLYRWLDFSPDSRRIVFPGADCVHVWDISSGAETGRVPQPDAFALTTVFAGDGASLIIADENRGVTRYAMRTTDSDPAGGKTPETLRTGEGWMAALRAQDGSVVLVNTMLGVAEILSPENPAGKRIGPHPAMHQVAFSPDGKRLATGTWQGNDIKVWDIASGQPLATLPAGENARVLWSSRNGIIAVRMTDATQWLEEPDGTWRRGLVWQPDPGQTFWDQGTLSPDGRLLALPQSGDRIRLVELATGKELITLEPPRASGLSAIRFSPDNRFLAACGTREQVVVWDLPELRRELAAVHLDWSD